MAKKAAQKVEPRKPFDDNKESRIINISVSRHSKRIYLRTRRRTILFAAVAFALPWIILGLVFLGVFGKKTLPDPARPLYKAAAGPWGQLDVYDYITRPPSEFLTDELFPPADVQWYFGRISRDALVEVLTTSGMPEPLREKLLDSSEFSSENGWVLRPSQELVISLQRDIRARLYSELAKLPENRRQVDPFVFEPAKLSEWLTAAQLNPATVGTVNKLLYPHGDSVLLTDGVTLMKTVADPAERRRLLGALLTRDTRMLKLRIPEHADIGALADYWGAGGRRAEVLTMLEGLHSNRQGMRIEILMLLPPFARGRLYNYPRKTDNPAALHRDCHWTAFNFFNETPDDRFIEPAKIKETLDTDYEKVTGAPTLGDVAMLVTPDDRTVHSCVYIADDIYFTKNGPSHISPWVLMQRKDILALFPAYQQLRTDFYRLKTKNSI